MRAGRRTRREELQVKVRRWEPVLRGLWEHPEVPQQCPFCRGEGVRVSWSLFNSPKAGRIGMSWDGWCEHCAEQFHSAVEIENPMQPASQLG